MGAAPVASRLTLAGGFDSCAFRYTHARHLGHVTTSGETSQPPHGRPHKVRPELEASTEVR